MDLLAGYGSDGSDSDSDEQVAAPEPPSAQKRSLHTSDMSFTSVLPAPRLLPSIAPEPELSHRTPSTSAAPSSSRAPETSLPSDFFDLAPPPEAARASLSLPADFFQTAPPAPSLPPDDPQPVLGPRRPNRPPPKFDDEPPAASSGLWSNLPKPKARRVVTLNVASKLLPAAASRPRTSDDDDDVRPAKKSRASGGKSALVDFLPAPKYSSFSTLDLDPADPTDSPTHSRNPSYPDPSTTSDPSYDVMYSNEAYRADQPTYDYPSEPQASSHLSQPYSYPSHPAPPAHPHTHSHPPSHHRQPHPPAPRAPGAPSGTSDLPAPGPNATAEEHDIFSQALRAERERVSRTAGSAAAEDVRFVELTQQQLKYVPPAAKETHDALKEALGSEYALEIRSQAKKYLGSKTARRRHQIGTLYHNAQVMELEMMEKRSQSMKSKKETAAKYGW